jgi:hypothetical protein
MTERKARIVRTAAALFAAAAFVFAGVLPATADVNTSSVKVTDPTSNEVIAGSYDSDGTAGGFKFTFKGQATTSCSTGWASIQFKVSGSSGTQYFNVSAPNAPPNWVGSAPTSWDTQPLKNGTYTVLLTVVEEDTLSLACNGQTGTNSVQAKVANPAKAPEWSSAPSAASDGSASVMLRWKKNAEDDVLEYRIVRTGPDGTKIAPVSAASPSGQGCSISSNVYVCEDRAFSSNYAGSYSYGLVALRERPAYNSSEEDKIECSTVSKPCVVSRGSDIQNVTLVAPSPDPTPSEEPLPPTNPPSTSPQSPGGGAGGGGGNMGSGPPRVLSFGSGSGSSNGFFSGTYSESLPYQPRTMILGGGSATSSPQARGLDDVISETAPDFRTVMLPVAGGLLAFLSAAHVRRLLLHL